MSTTTTKPTLSLKLLIDAKEKRVLFAEAGKDFVDLLFSLMLLPIGTVVSLLSTDKMVGSLGKVYQSVENLRDTYIQPDADKTALLNPNAEALDGVGVGKLAPVPNCTPVPKPIYGCSFDHYGNRCRVITDDPNDTCPNHSYPMSIKLNLVPPKASPAAGGGGGYVKDVVTYMVMDDLEVKPMSTLSSIALMKMYGIRVGDLQERLVSIGMDEGLKLLKASFESKTILSDLFLGTGNGDSAK